MLSHPRLTLGPSDLKPANFLGLYGKIPIEDIEDKLGSLMSLKLSLMASVIPSALPYFAWNKKF